MQISVPTICANRYIDFGEHGGGSYNFNILDSVCRWIADDCDLRGAKDIFPVKDQKTNDCSLRSLCCQSAIVSIA